MATKNVHYNLFGDLWETSEKAPEYNNPLTTLEQEGDEAEEEQK